MQAVPFLLFKMQQGIQEEAKSTQGQMDKGLSQGAGRNLLRFLVFCAEFQMDI